MATITKFEDLEIWKLAREQATEINMLAKEGGFAKDFELKNQISAAAGSVMDNIADPDITFDKAGVCNYYHEYKVAEKDVFTGTKGEERLQH